MAGAADCQPDAAEDSTSSMSMSLPGTLTVAARVSRHSADSLSTDIDTSLLRGVPAAVVLQGFGASFRKHEFRQQDYLKSASVEHLDAFISHDWASSWFGKTLVLCLIHNSRPAAFASLLVGLLLAALQSEALRVLPTVTVTDHYGTRAYGYWCEGICPVVFAVVFFSWQSMRAALHLRTTMLFLDKYCIDQDDESRKAAGIAGLGGFLKHSDRLVICWTPRYFTRLWCVYEVASWLHLQKPMSQVDFMPLSHAKAIVIAGLSSYAMSLSYALFLPIYPKLVLFLFFAAMIVVFPMAMHFGRRWVHDIRKLPEQLRDFRIANAGCFCCDNNHIWPSQPSAPMPCDRLIVYETLQGWFPSEDMEGCPDRDAHLSQFDAEVRDFFGPGVMQKAGPTELPYSVIVLVGLPWLFRGLDSLAFLGSGCSVDVLIVCLIEYPVAALAILPVVYKSLLHFFAWVDSKVGIPVDPVRDALATALCSLFLGSTVCLLWVPIAVGIAHSLSLGFAFGALDVAVAAVVFRQDLARSQLATWSRCVQKAAHAKRSCPGRHSNPCARQRRPEPGEMAAAPDKQGRQAVEAAAAADVGGQGGAGSELIAALEVCVHTTELPDLN